MQIDKVETFVKIGKLMRITKNKPVPNWFALSNMNLRFYSTEITPVRRNLIDESFSNNNPNSPPVC